MAGPGRPIAPEDVHALVVGVERYGMGECGDLDGPVFDAVGFTDWLLSHGVPERNVRLFLSPIDANQAIQPKQWTGPRAKAAEYAAIREALFQDLATQIGELLYVFWSGHGVSDDTDNRFLFFADASSTDRRNLNLTSLLERFRGEPIQFPQQVFLIDACGSLTTDLGIGIPKDDYGAEGRSRPTRQSVFFAAGPGQPAKNLTAEKTGLFSRELLAVLAAQPSFPPSLPEVLSGVEARFAQLKDAGVARQVPQRFEAVIEGRRRSLHDGAAPEPNAVGSLVPKLCNRTYQDSDFWLTFHRAVESGPSVQVFVVFGEEFEAHRSLVQRLVGERIRRVAESIAGDQEGTVKLIEVLDWPTGGTLPRLTAKLGRSLHAAAESKADSTERAYEILARSPGFSDHRLIVVGQQVYLAGCDAVQLDLLRWYLGEFWRADLGPNDPTLVVFLQVVCAESMAAAPPGGSPPKTELWSALESAASAPGGRPPILLDELTELTEPDLRNWFVRYIEGLAGPALNVADEARRIRHEAKTRRDGIPRTDHIEQLLADVHEHWVEQAGVGG